MIINNSQNILFGRYLDFDLMIANDYLDLGDVIGR